MSWYGCCCNRGEKCIELPCSINTDDDRLYIFFGFRDLLDGSYRVEASIFTGLGGPRSPLVSFTTTIAAIDVPALCNRVWDWGELTLDVDPSTDFCDWAAAECRITPLGDDLLDNTALAPPDCTGPCSDAPPRAWIVEFRGIAGTCDGTEGGDPCSDLNGVEFELHRVANDVLYGCGWQMTDCGGRCAPCEDGDAEPPDTFLLTVTGSLDFMPADYCAGLCNDVNRSYAVQLLQRTDGYGCLYEGKFDPLCTAYANPYTWMRLAFSDVGGFLRVQVDLGTTLNTKYDTFVLVTAIPVPADCRLIDVTLPFDSYAGGGGACDMTAGATVRVQAVL